MLLSNQVPKSLGEAADQIFKNYLSSDWLDDQMVKMLASYAGYLEFNS